MTAALVLALAVCLAGCGGLGSVNVDTGPTPITGTETARRLLDGVLGEHVVDGRVNYAALCGDGRLDRYLNWVANTDPESLAGADERLAFWINVYNAYTLKAVCERYPIDSINDLHSGGLVLGMILRKTVWHRKLAVVGGRKLSLNDIEHGIVRPDFRDPRAHFALVCAAESCPPLRSKAYRGEVLDDQLNDQGRRFFADPLKNRFDTATRTAYLSKILDWYGDDFGKSRRDILLYATRFLADDAAAAIRADPEGWSVSHTHYDWSLNE